MTHKRFLALTILALALLIVMLGATAVSANGGASGTIHGVVYCDTDYSYSPIPAEGIAGVPVSLWNDANCDNVGEGVPTTQDTLAGGIYTFAGLALPTTPVDTCYIVEADETAPELGNCNYIPYWDNPRNVSLYSNQSYELNFRFLPIWEKLVEGEPWVPGMEVTSETSETITVVDTFLSPWRQKEDDRSTTGLEVSLPQLGERWDPNHLELLSVEYDAYTSVISDLVTGVLTWYLPLPNGQVIDTATLTKTFLVKPCTWVETTVKEGLFIPELGLQGGPEGAIQGLEAYYRPFVVKKTAPLLHIDSTYDSEVDPGTQASFVLAYSNTGGFENEAMIRNDFPASAAFDSANPAADRSAFNLSTGESWAEWDLGALANGDRGEITVNVNIGADLPPSTTIPITDSIYNHIGKEIDTVISTFHIQQPPLSLGDFVWFDTNQDGIQDAGEAGVEDITVTLHRRLCSEPVMATDVTDANGKYLFEDLSPGVYCLQFADIPAGWTISPQSQGGDDTKDSDVDPTTAQIGDIQLQATDLDEDMGLFVDGSKGGTVYCDANLNSQLDAGEGVAGVTVTLHDDPGCDGAPINQVTAMDTPAGGVYLFDDLNAGPPGGPECYYVSVDDGDMGSCDVPITPLDYAVQLDADDPDHLDNDFGFQVPPPEPSSLGDLVWNDTNHNGIQDASESGIAGVSVTLYDCEGNQLRTATTASGGTYSRNGMAQGAYLFNDLAAGSYQIGFALPTSDYEFSPQNQGADDALDSDADPVSGRTACIVMAAGVDDMDWDAGMYEVIIEAEPPPIVPEASTLLLLGSALSGLAGYAGMQIRARRRK